MLGANNHLQQLDAVWRTVLYLTTVGFVKEYWRYNRSKQVIRGDLTFWIVWGLAHSASFIVCCWTLWTLWLADCRCGAPQGGQTFLRGNLDFMYLLVNLKVFSLHGHCMCYYSLMHTLCTFRLIRLWEWNRKDLNQPRTWMYLNVFKRYLETCSLCTHHSFLQCDMM